MRLRAGLSAALFGVLVASACGSFGEGDPPGPTPPTTEADAKDGAATGDGDIADALATTPDAQLADGGCGFDRPAFLRCGTKLCDRPAGQACCVDSKTCAKSCSSTQWTCLGKQDCPTGDLCCNAGGSVGSACVASCQTRPQYCYRSDECPKGQGCFPALDGNTEIWRCAPCP